jgi:hypothetical protein
MFTSFFNVSINLITMIMLPSSFKTFFSTKQFQNNVGANISSVHNMLGIILLQVDASFKLHQTYKIDAKNLATAYTCRYSNSRIQ